MQRGCFGKGSTARRGLEQVEWCPTLSRQHGIVHTLAFEKLYSPRQQRRLLQDFDLPRFVPPPPSCRNSHHRVSVGNIAERPETTGTEQKGLHTDAPLFLQAGEICPCTCVDCARQQRPELLSRHQQLGGESVGLLFHYPPPRLGIGVHNKVSKLVRQIESLSVVVLLQGIQDHDRSPVAVE